MVVTGYSLSPGGLLFPYHIGVLSSLSHNGFLTESNPIAGSSAGAIAVASHADDTITPERSLDAIVRITKKCDESGGARGNLMKPLFDELNDMLEDDVHHRFNSREAVVGLAHKEIFPVPRNVLETKFGGKDHVIDAVCNSSMFPFFTNNLPFRVGLSRQKLLRSSGNVNSDINDQQGLSNTKDTQLGPILNGPLNSFPRIVVDGYFTVPRERFGCPDLDPFADRTVTISPFPHDVIGLTASNEFDRISPAKMEGENSSAQVEKLFRLAIETASEKEYYELYEDGLRDAELWCRKERQRQ